MKDREHHMQVAFFKIARMYLAHTPHIIYANPNQGQYGGKSAARKGAYFKAEGKLSGVPDTFLAWARLGFHGLYIEFKLPNDPVTGKGKTYLSKEQKALIPQLRETGYCVAVCRDITDAFELMKRYTLDEDADLVMREHNWK